MPDSQSFRISTMAICSGTATRLPGACRAARGRRFYFASGWNFGPADADVKPVSWIADELVRLWAGGASWVLDSGAHPHEAHALKLDATKAAHGLDWRPTLPLRQALAWIAEWYQAFCRGADLKQFTLEQIEQYESFTKD